MLSSSVALTSILLGLNAIISVNSAGHNRILPLSNSFIKAISPSQKRSINIALTGALALQRSTSFVACQITYDAQLAVDSILGSHKATGCQGILTNSPSSSSTNSKIIAPVVDSTEPSSASINALLSSPTSLSPAVPTPSPKSLQAALAASQPGSDVTTPAVVYIANLTSTQTQSLNDHNVARARHHASSLSWSTELATAAQKFANSCTWGHSLPGSILPVTMQYGENIYASDDPTDDLSSAVQSFLYGEDTYDYNKQGFSQEFGQLTQLLWNATRTVGCGVNHCNLDVFSSEINATTIVVCLYHPPGNVNSYTAFQSNVFPV